MKIPKFNFKNPKFEKLQGFLFPLVTLAIIVGLSVTVGKAMVNRVFEIRDTIAELNSKNTILVAKRQTLTNLNKDELTRGVKASTRAIPDEGPVLPAFVAIRAVATSKGLQVNNVRFSGSVDSSTNLKIINFSFDTQGTLQATIGFLRDIKNTAPLIRVQKVKFAVNENNVSGSITVHSMWEPLPETYGKVDDPIGALGQAEKELLAKMMELTTVTTNAPSTGAVGGRKNPFSY
ncbi:MAG: hypothetical protein Q7S79_02145 [bacterium]|nr:hypothetical protein [bacterium]